MAQLERRYYHFWGRVQGVGFRYRAQYAAQLLELTGWVANLWDGSVELEAQGDPAQLDKLVPTMLNGNRWIQIEDWKMKQIPPKPDERRFRVTGGY